MDRNIVTEGRPCSDNIIDVRNGLECPPSVDCPAGEAAGECNNGSDCKQYFYNGNCVADCRTNPPTATDICQRYVADCEDTSNCEERHDYSEPYACNLSEMNCNVGFVGLCDIRDCYQKWVTGNCINHIIESPNGNGGFDREERVECESTYLPCDEAPFCPKKQGCTDPTASNYDSEANDDDGSCEIDIVYTDIWGCSDSSACNYNDLANQDDGSCDYTCFVDTGYGGCLDLSACNPNPGASYDDSSCDYSCYEEPYI